jgi:hypothetical protein
MTNETDSRLAAAKLWISGPSTQPMEKQPIPGTAEAPTASTPTLKPNAGDALEQLKADCKGAAAFKLTREEREAISNVLDNYKEGRYPTHCDAINAIEDVINDGWQTCTCRVDTAD